MACTPRHNLTACATLRVRAYLRGGHHQAHALLRIALFLYDGGGAVHEGVNSRRGLRLRLLPPTDAHHALITCCSSKRESLKPACVAFFGSQESHGSQGCTPSMCCSEQCGMNGAAKKQCVGVVCTGTLSCSCVANMQHRRSCQDKWLLENSLTVSNAGCCKQHCESKAEKCRDCKGSRLLTVVRLMHFDSSTRALPQLRYGFTPSAYESAHMHHRDEQPVPNLYVRLPRHMLQLHR